VTSPAKTVVATGYVALDVIRFGETVRQRAGGTAANVAAGLAYFGWGAAIAGRIGQDTPGRRIRSELQRQGVDVRALLQEPSLSTPVVLHEVRPPAHHFGFTCPQCGRRSPRFSALRIEDARSDIENLLNGATVVFADRISAGMVELFKGADGSLKVLEPSSRGVASIAEEATELADVIKWSHELRSELHEVVLKPRPGQIKIETLGAKGLRFRIGHGPWRRIAGLSIDPVDTAGAGDWMTAAFLDALPGYAVAALSEEDLAAALRTSQEVAALSCLYIGARTLSDVSRQEVRLAAQALVKGELTSPPSIDGGRRSQAENVCDLCLGPG
jgi:sugar/nucleoside kinase (ribokinase family)